MVDEATLRIIQQFLTLVNHAGIHANRAVILGSYARGEAHPESDIDLLVIAPEFDHLQDRRLVNELWHQRLYSDSRIEPIPCGERQWLEDDSSAIIEIARREGQVIHYQAKAA